MAEIHEKTRRMEFGALGKAGRTLAAHASAGVASPTYAPQILLPMKQALGVHYAAISSQAYV
jgi:hypothetical protein